MLAPLLSTKLYIPSARSDVLVRPRLRARLNQALSKQLTLLSAPAGFGKTTLLADWIHATTGNTQNPNARPSVGIAWVSLDDADNDPARFWSYVASALDAVQPGSGEAALGLLQSPQSPPLESILTVLINALSELDADTVLVFDDYHVVNAPDIHNAVKFLLAHLPPRLHLIFTTRSDPPLPLAQLRARDELLELRAGDLRFTNDEAAALLNDVMQLRLSASDVSLLDARTEGWIAGLQLAALSMRGRGDVHGFISSFSGSNRYIIEYLVEQVLDVQPPAVQQFLLQTSILARLCAGLCDAVTERADGEAMLGQLSGSNLFLTPLDDNGEWYRYHQLFGEVLETRLQKLDAALPSNLHARASRWYEQQRQFEPALQHAAASGDSARLAQLLAANGRTLVDNGELVTLRRWLAALPSDAPRAQPYLHILRGWLELFLGEYDKVEAHLQASEDMLPSATTISEFDARRIRGESAMLRAAVAAQRGDIARTITFNQLALANLPEQDTLGRSRVASNLSDAYFYSGDMPAMAEHAIEAFTIAQAGGHVYPAVLSLYYLAVTELFVGRLRDAQQTCRRALDYAATPGERPAVLAPIFVTLGLLAHEWNDLGSAVENLHIAHELAQRLGQSEIQADVYDGMLQWLQTQPDHPRSQQVIEAAEALLREHRLSPFVCADLPAQIALARLRQGHVSAALEWARDAAASGPLDFIHETAHIALARVWLARGQTAEALELLDRLLSFLEGSGQWGMALEVLALQACAYHAQGSGTAAMVALERALLRGEPEGYLRTFLDEGNAMQALLVEYKSTLAKQATGDGKKLWPYLEKLLAAFPLPTQAYSHPTPGPSPKSALVDPLSAREVEVLRLLARGDTNQAIAAQLVLSLNTVKRHVTHIFEKLEATNRTEAVNRARELHLL